MRELADAERIARFLRALGRAADTDSACYLTGGATAVLFGWRATTIDVSSRPREAVDRGARAETSTNLPPEELRLRLTPPPAPSARA